MMVLFAAPNLAAAASPSAAGQQGHLPEVRGNNIYHQA